LAYTISTLLAIYFVVWWVTLFLTLPFGIRSQREEGEEIPGTDPGAPSLPHMARKLIWTTILSAVFFAAGMAAYYADYLNIARLSKLMGLPI
jgi:predicted secreted protein